MLRRARPCLIQPAFLSTSSHAPLPHPHPCLTMVSIQLLKCVQPQPQGLCTDCICTRMLQAFPSSPILAFPVLTSPCSAYGLPFSLFTPEAESFSPLLYTFPWFSVSRLFFSL